MRLHELAKKLGVSSKELMEACRQQGFEAKSHFRAATPEIILAMNQVFGGRSAAKVEIDDKPKRRTTTKRKSDSASSSTSGSSTAKPAKPSAAPKTPRTPSKRKRVTRDLPTPPASGGEGEEGSQHQVPHVDHHAHRHKRADFKSRSNRSILPAEPAISDRYSDVVYGPERRSRGRRRRRRPNAAMLAAQAAQQAQRAGVAPGTPSKTQLRKRETTPEHVVEVPSPVTPRALSAALGVKLNDIIKLLIGQGIMANINDPLPDETAELIALNYEKELRFTRSRNLEEEVEEEFNRESDEGNLVGRPPVIAFLGHVDHGKTSLLDFIRRSKVVDTEAGGITQHIGAYRLTTEQGTLCFLDTPGHEAFSSMRARGANLTDIVVLVCAADDGVMPQTREAYAHAKAAGVPVVVAINKCDLPNANPTKALQELSSIDEGMLPEEWGGKTGMIQCSAATGEGVEELLERIHLEAELLELKCDPQRNAEGHVLEAELSQDRGVIANLLVQNGTLRQGDVVLCGAGYGKVKAMYGESGQPLDEAEPATPVSVAGLSEVPEAGDKFYAIEDLAKARDIASRRGDALRAERLHARTHVNLNNLTEYLQSAEVKELRVVLKADVMGTLEVLRKTMNDLATAEVKINIIHAGVGGINQADIILADASDAIVVGFHVTADPDAASQAEDRKVQIKIYHIIYRLVEDLKAALSGLLPPEEREIIQGHVEVRQVFKVSRLGNIAGCFVRDGTVSRNSRIRVFRDNVMIYEGRLASLQRFKDQVREVREGYECGLRIQGYDAIQVGDVLEAYTTEEIARTLD